jgi:hypothetical protein
MKLFRTDRLAVGRASLGGSSRILWASKAIKASKTLSWHFVSLVRLDFSLSHIRAEWVQTNALAFGGDKTKGKGSRYPITHN